MIIEDDERYSCFLSTKEDTIEAKQVQELYNIQSQLITNIEKTITEINNVSSIKTAHITLSQEDDTDSKTLNDIIIFIQKCKNDIFKLNNF